MKKTLLTTAIVLTGIALFANDTENETIITEVTNTKDVSTTLDNQEDFYYIRRFTSITELGTTFAYSKPSFTMNQVIGVRVNPYFSIGQGFGLQVSSEKLVQLQTTLDMRMYLLDKKITPMFTVQAGLNKVSNAPVGENKNLKDAQFMLDAGTGLLFKAKENASFTLNGGYTMFTDFNKTINGGFVKIGYVF